jgi:CHAD domain-containing protein
MPVCPSKLRPPRKPWSWSPPLGWTCPICRIWFLEATYHDTVDLRLVRAGITLWRGAGASGPAWFVKSPENDAGDERVTKEIHVAGAAGAADTVPGAVAELVLATTRGVPLEVVVRLTTARRVTEIRLDDGQLLAELVDDTISVAPDEQPVGRFREVALALHASGSAGTHGRRFLDAAVSRLVGAGCSVELPLSRLAQALGEPATRPADVVVPPQTEEVSITDLVRHVTARSVAQIIRHDPGARLGRDPEGVHKLRVATRRLRSDLHSFGALLDPAVVGPIRSELRWLGGVVGTVRDTDVLGARLDARLAALSAAEARAAMLSALREVRYLRLLDALVALAAKPPFRKTRAIAPRPSRRMAAGIVQKPWRRVVKAVDARGPDPTDIELHEVRILAKRSRYAAEAAAPLLEPSATRFAAAVADVQTVLGDHQDTVLAEAWLHNALDTLPEVGETAQRLIGVERERRVALRAQWPDVWRKACAKKLHTWH